MIKNHLKIARRSLLKNKSFSAINITGLAIGLTAVLLIAIWVQNQFLYDNFYANKAHIYQLMNRTDKDGNVNIHGYTMPAAAPALQQQYPEVEFAARVSWTDEHLFLYEGKSIKSRGFEVDADFLDIFDFPVLYGMKNSMLDEPNSIVLTASFAASLFGYENPINKTITLEDNVPYKVTGVLKDLPTYTDFDFKYLMPLSPERAQKSLNNWNNYSLRTYVTLRENAEVHTFNEKIKPLIRENASYLEWTSIFLYPISKTHLYSRFENGIPVGGKIEQVRLVAGIGFLILLIACINFINLSTARSQKRSKEVGVRKVIGATKKTLVSQFLSESILIAFIAGLISVVLTLISLPLFNRLLDKPLVVDWANPMIWGTGVTFMLITGLLAGVYPAFVLSSFRPIKTLKGIVSISHRPFNFRAGLVVVQFAIAVFLIVATLVIHLQVKFAGEREAGYQTAKLIEIAAEGEIDNDFDALKGELISNRLATHVTRTSGWTVAGGYSSTAMNFSWDGATPEQIDNSFFYMLRTESDFAKTLGLTLSDGRDIDYARVPADSASVLLNETAIKHMGLENPVGKYLKWGDNLYTIVGVVEDYIFNSPYEDVGPLLVLADNQYLHNIVIRSNPQLSMSQNIQGIEKIVKKFNPDYPFSYKFVDEQYAQKFHDQKQMGMLAFIFSMLAIFISALGLFGLASYIAETRIKEIGIRKVLGASIIGISTMLSRDFIKLVVISLLLATPIAWWIMNKWLENFSYRTAISWWVFALAGVAAIAIALLTISGQAIRAALANPVDSLRDE